MHAQLATWRATRGIKGSPASIPCDESFFSSLNVTDCRVPLPKDAHPDNQPPLPFSLSSFPGSNAPKRISRALHFSNQLTHTDGNAPVKDHDADTAGDSGARPLAGGATLNPDEYLQARKQLKRAVSEHYHALEVLNNYRVRSTLGLLVLRR